jgi:hypothetical protein
LAGEGKWEEALPELLWCFDEGMPQISSYTGVRTSFLLSEIAKLARNYPPALEALRARREKAETAMMANAGDRNAARDFSALTRTLGEQPRMMEIYDRLPASDPRRGILGAELFEALLGQKRYVDALAAQPYERMVARFETVVQDSNRPASSEMAQRSLRNLAVANAAKQIEVLAGAGDVANARTYAGRVLALDNSPETRSLLRNHLARAGHPDLLDAP